MIGFDDLHAVADAKAACVPVVAVGAADVTVLEALRAAADRGWIRPIVAGSGAEITALAQSSGIPIGDFEIVESDEPARAAVELARAGRAAMLIKGRIATPDLMSAVLDAEHGLRRGRTIGQVVLMEIARVARRFVLADTGVMIRPSLEHKAQILQEAAEVARTLGAQPPRVALMAASEKVSANMPETMHAAELERRGRDGEFGDCIVQGPLSFDLAYNAAAASKKGVLGDVIGAADAMIFPDLLSANLTVKAIMYTADCRYGGVLRGTSHPVVFMSRADSAQVRLDSLALALCTSGTQGSAPIADG
jgi:phosphotransacetylase